MVFGLCHQRERLFKSLYVVQIFILAGGLYYYLQRSVEKTAPAHEVAGASLQPVEETLRPVWGPMNKCYPVTAQRRRIKSGKKPAPKQAVTPEATGRPSDTAPKEEANSLSQDDGKARSPRLEAASPIRPGEEAAEEAAAGIPGWTGDEKAQKESAVYLGKTANSTLLRTASLPNLGDPVEVTDSPLLSDPPVPGRRDVQAARSPDLLE